MLRPQQLSSIERRKILGKRACGMRDAAISRSIDRSRTVVNKFFKDPSKYSKCKHTERPNVLLME